MAGYVLTRAADQDLIGVWNYTFETWGADQADHYLDLLDACCEQIAAGKAICRSLHEIAPRLKSHRCQHHYIFFLETDKVPIVIAVLHERMDFLTRLKDRLD